MHSALLLQLLPLAFAAPSARSEPAPLLVPRGEVLPHKYIVKFKDNADIDSPHAMLQTMGVKADTVYKNVFNGFAATLNADAIKQLRNNPAIDFIEQDGVAKISTWVSQAGAPWGLGRVSHRAKGNTNYAYDDSAGAGTCVYVIDTGVEATHPEFGGRASQIQSFVSGQTTDGNGHGTHCAGTIGSKTYGAAKKTTIYGVKVLDNSGSGSYSQVISGMDFVVQDSKKRNCPKGVFASMSLGGGKSDAVNAGAAAIIKANIFLAVAAGNSQTQASGFSPASEPTVCTVGATASNDAFASDYSNYGPLVDILAPGTGVLSTWIGGGTRSISGTSMATPHVAGVAAFLAGLEGFPGAQALCERLRTISTKNAISGVPSGTVNYLLYNNNPGV